MTPVIVHRPPRGKGLRSRKAKQRKRAVSNLLLARKTDNVTRIGREVTPWHY